MNLALWIAAGLLATLSLFSGITKTFVPKEKLAAAHSGGEWLRHASTGFVKTIGVLELLAAVGLILPGALDVAPFMVPVTAVCWILLMVGAMITHGRLGQFALATLNFAYLAIAAFVAWAASALSRSPADDDAPLAGWCRASGQGLAVDARWKAFGDQGRPRRREEEGSRHEPRH